jgi:hypothetical protein
MPPAITMIDRMITGHFIVAAREASFLQHHRECKVPDALRRGPPTEHVSTRTFIGR